MAFGIPHDTHALPRVFSGGCSTLWVRSQVFKIIAETREPVALRTSDTARERRTEEAQQARSV